MPVFFVTVYTVDDTHTGKYTPQQRNAQRSAFYQRLLAEPTTIEPPTSPSHQSSSGSNGSGGKSKPKPKLTLALAADALSGDELLPPIALERLDVHHELAAIKYAHPTAWKREVWFHIHKYCKFVLRYIFLSDIFVKIFVVAIMEFRGEFVCLFVSLAPTILSSFLSYIVDRFWGFNDTHRALRSPSASTRSRRTSTAKSTALTRCTSRCLAAATAALTAAAAT